MSSYDRQGPQVSFAMPRIGPALKGVLAAIAVVGIVQAILIGYVHDVGVTTFEALVMSPKAVLQGQIWRLLTAALLTDPTSMGHLIFTLIGLYFLLAGNEAVEPLVAAASMGFYAAMLLFAFIGLPAVWRRA